MNNHNNWLTDNKLRAKRKKRNIVAKPTKKKI